MTKTTISVIKADVGSLPGHVEAPEQLIQVCDEHLNLISYVETPEQAWKAVSQFHDH